MNQTQDKEKLRKGGARKAVALAMQSRWSEAAAANLSILSEFPNDLEAYNRLGKAQMELGRLSDAKAAFQSALEISPHNPIAKKNLDRLSLLGGERVRRQSARVSPSRAFIEESGKAVMTSLVNIAGSEMLLQMAPGHPVQLHLSGGPTRVEDSDGEYLGQLEPRLASRLTRLTDGGNRYEATVTSADDHELSIIIRETHKHPSQAGTTSFPSRPGAKVAVAGAVLRYDQVDDDGEQREAIAVKDWSDDDTEPGDDDAFSPVIHRIINGDGSNSEEE